MTDDFQRDPDCPVCLRVWRSTGARLILREARCSLVGDPMPGSSEAEFQKYAARLCPRHLEQHESVRAMSAELYERLEQASSRESEVNASLESLREQIEFSFDGLFPQKPK